MTTTDLTVYQLRVGTPDDHDALRLGLYANPAAAKLHGVAEYEQRFGAADCVARWSAALNAQDAGLEPGEPEGLRWWRNSPSRDETHNTDPNEES